MKATLGGVNDVRMGAQELCLRYIVINSYYNWEKHDFNQYYGLTKSMDKMVLLLNTYKKSELESILNEFRVIMLQAHMILQGYSFCKIGQKRINTALFTSWAVVLYNMNYFNNEIQMKAEKIRKLYVAAIDEDGELYKVITSSTGSKKNIIKAIEIIRGLFNKI